MVEYGKFGDYLDERNDESFSIRFEEIEKIIGQKLSASAYQYTAWWGNHDSHPLMKVVLSKNWKSRNLNLGGKWIIFYKNSESPLLKFVRDEMKMNANYQPIVIKMLLESNSRKISFDQNKTDDEYLDFLIQTIENSTEQNNWKFTRIKPNLIQINKNDEIFRIAIFQSSSERQSPLDVYLGVSNSAIEFLNDVSPENRFLMIINHAVKNFVLLPYSIEQKYARFVSSSGSGTKQWDETGKGNHAFHITIDKDSSSMKTNDNADENILDCTKYLGTLNQIFGSPLNGDLTSITVKKIRDKFAELNFGVDTQSSIISVKDTLSGRGLVTFTGTGDNDTAKFVDGVSNYSEIPEILKICGQRIVKWHIENIVKNEKLGIWRILPGRSESNFKHEKEFRELNSIGVGYGMDNLDLTNLTIDEVKKECDRIFTMKYPQKQQATPAMKAAVTAITHKITTKDIVVLTRGEKEIIDFGIVTSKYFFNEKGESGWNQRRKVVWLNQGPISKTVLPLISKGPASALWQFPDESEEKIIEYLLEENVEYFLLRHNVDGTWKDDLGKKYHFGKTVPNQKKLREIGPGTHTIWFTKQSGEFYFWGYGTVNEIETIQENLEWNLVYDNFKYFVRNYDTSIAARGKFLKKANKSNKEEIENLPKYNIQTSMFPITKKIYDQILSQDLSHNNGGSTY